MQEDQNNQGTVNVPHWTEWLDFQSELFSRLAEEAELTADTVRRLELELAHWRQQLEKQEKELAALGMEEDTFALSTDLSDTVQAIKKGSTHIKKEELLNHIKNLKANQ